MLGLTPAPELHRSGLRWFNVSRPLSLSDLRNRLVVLDFWTACCVNCLHVLPTLRRLEETFADSIAVIGVNSPKYPAEQDADNLANALMRLDIRHPVIHDPELLLWRDYGVQAWPTLVLVDPRGRILGDLPGEPSADKLISGIGEMLRTWRNTLAPPPLPLPVLETKVLTSRFRFPAKIKPVGSHGADKLWAIADSGHHQIVLCDDEGREVRRFGRGQPGFLDLDGEACAFNSPQGLCCDAQSIYVADTGNHAIRHIELATGAVRTLAGTGERGSPLDGPAAGRDTGLASVWDIECLNDRLFFANAGTHQLGCLNLRTGEVSALAGSGYEELADGAGTKANLAQPAGLALDRATGTLYFVDSETSSVRAVAADGNPVVETLVGAGLFECGRRNGDFARARLQHCLGISWWNGSLVVADTYNSTLRVLDLASRQVSELGGDDYSWSNGLRFDGGEPAGVASDGANRLLVCDTNHHRIIELTCDGSRRARVWSA
ncbi:MAG: redoxin domain-containing protein [Rhodospirillales bacterium]|nr:redoxin domain-containing protein [Rhodospirillales bacterium]